MYEHLKSQKVGMTVEEFTTDKAKHGRRGSPAIPRGTKLYAIKYSIGGYFTYSYVNRADAEQSIENSIKHETDNRYYWEWNMKKNVQDTLHVGPRTK